MDNREMALALRDKGYTAKQIATLMDISEQRVSQLIGGSKRFRKIGHECPYVNLRNWMNKNRVSRGEFLRRMGYALVSDNYTKLCSILRGKQQPRKDYIDLMLRVTGMTYEEMFKIEVRK